MPEAVPPLQIPSDNSTEICDSSTAAEVTDRSTDSHSGNRQAVFSEKRLFVKSQGKNKMRKSLGRRSLKKTQFKPLIIEKKATSVLKHKSHIPRARDLLTRSSSNTSLSASDSLASPLVNAVKTLTEEKRSQITTNNFSCLVRQKSAVILAFRQRKSFSEMDFSHARRQISFPISSHTINRHIKDSCENKVLVPSNSVENLIITRSKNSFVQQMCNQDCYFGLPGRDPQMAGMRIFATIMLNAWRKRRDEVRRLIAEVADLKRTATKAKNQLHVFNSLFRVEQKRNDELNFQLKRSLENVNRTKTSCENLTTSLISLKADKALLEQQLQTKEHEFESINALLAQTKSDLFKSMTVQRELQASLSMEQRKVQTLENQKNELINEICELNQESMEKENELHKEIQEKCDEFSNLKQKLCEAEEHIKLHNRSTERFLSENKTREERMAQEIEYLESELKMMKKYLDESIGNRVKNFWNNSVSYQKITLYMLHWLVYYTMPATPPPRIKGLPFGLSLNKALSIVRR